RAPRRARSAAGAHWCEPLDGVGEGSGEVAVRATLAALVCLVLAACTGGGGKEQEPPDRSAGRALRLAVASVPLNCQEVPGMPTGCQVGDGDRFTQRGRVVGAVRRGW